MKKEYIILTSNNEWVSTCQNKEDALLEMADLKNNPPIDSFDEYKAETYYLYEAKEIKRFNT